MGSIGLTEGLRKLISILAIDFKGDLADVRGRLGLEYWKHFSYRKNFRVGTNPPGDLLPPNIWINQYSKILAARCGLIMASSCLASIMRFALAALNPVPKPPLLWPSIQLIYDIARAAPLDVFSSKPDYGKTLLQALDDLIGSSDEIFDCFRGFDVQHIIEPGLSAVIDLVALPPRLTNIIVDVLVSQLLYPRLYHRHTVDTTEVMLIIDEADHLCTVRSSEAYPEGYSPLAMLAKMGREPGIMLCLGVAHIGQVTQFIRSNMSYHLMLSQPDYLSLREAARTTLVPQSSEMLLASLGRGVCVYKESLGPCNFPMLMQIDHVPPSREPAPDQFDSHPYIPGKRLHELPHVQEALKRLISEHRRSRPGQSGGKTETLPENAHKLLNMNSLNPFMPVARLLDRLGILSPATRKAARNELERRLLAEFKGTRISQTTELLMDITEKGYRYLRKNPPPGRGHGGVVHRHFCEWVRMAGVGRGHKASTEWLIPGSKHLVDVAWKTSNGWNVFEIVVECRANLVSHLTTILASEVVKGVTVVAAQKGIVRDLKKQLKRCEELTPHMDRVSFDVIEPYMLEVFPR